MIAIIAILVVSVLSVCPEVKMELRGNSAVDEVVDAAHMESAQKGCRKYYGSNACLVRFIKIEDRNYHAICRRDAK